MKCLFYYLMTCVLSINFFITESYSSNILFTNTDLKKDFIKTEYNKFDLKQLNENYLPKFAVYFDLVGTGGIVSINADMVLLQKEKLFVNAKAGIGTFLLGIVVPVGISANFGKNNNFLETGFYFMPYSIVGLFGSEPELNIGFAPVIGYKHFAYKKLFFRAYVSPVFIPSNNVFFPLAGLSFGYSF